MLHQRAAGVMPLGCLSFCWQGSLPPCSHALTFPESQKIETERSFRSLSPALMGCGVVIVGYHGLWPPSSYVDASTNRVSCDQSWGISNKKPRATTGHSRENIPKISFSDILHVHFPNTSLASPVTLHSLCHYWLWLISLPSSLWGRSHPTPLRMCYRCDREQQKRQKLPHDPRDRGRDTHRCPKGCHHMRSQPVPVSS